MLRIEPEVTEKLRILQKELDEVERDATLLDGYKKIVEEIRTTQMHVRASRDEMIKESREAQAQTQAYKEEIVEDERRTQTQARELKDEVVEEVRRARTRQDDSHKAKYTVPPNCNQLLLNLNDDFTLEGKLKQLVLRGETKLVGAIGSQSRVRVASAYGISGVGKTCAVKAVGNDKEVQKHYVGGVYSFSFGPNISDEGVTSMIADAVNESGGSWIAEEIRNAIGLDSAMRKASGWFGDKKCLFICDDMWRSIDRNSGYLHIMRCLCRERSDGCVLLSTRDLQVAEEVESENSVRFGAREDEKAGDILCRSAGLSRDKMSRSARREIRESCKSVLEICGGLPVALAVAGRTIAGIGICMRKTNEHQHEAGGEIVEYRERLDKHSRYGDHLVKKGHGDHAGLFTALKVSLETADRTARTEGCRRSLSELHRGLCVLQKQQ